MVSWKKKLSKLSFFQGEFFCSLGSQFDLSFFFIYFSVFFHLKRIKLVHIKCDFTLCFSVKDKARLRNRLQMPAKLKLFLVNFKKSCFLFFKENFHGYLFLCFPTWLFGIKMLQLLLGDVPNQMCEIQSGPHP